MSWSFAVEILGSLSEMNARSANWSAFVLDNAVEGGIYCDPAFAEHAAGFAKRGHLVLATCRRDGETVGMMPFKLLRGRFPVSLGTWKVSVSASELRLYDFEFAAKKGTNRLEVLTRALPALCRSVPCDLVSIDNCPVGESLAPWAWSRERGLRILARNIQRTFLLEFPPTFDAYWSTLGGKTRNTLSRKVKKLEKHCGGDLQFRRFSKPGEMAELHGCLRRVWKKSWHAQVKSGAPPAAAHLESLAGHGWVRSYVLFAKDTPVAYLLGFQYKGKFFYESLAYDPGWRDFSPGTVLNCLMLKELYAQDTPGVLDFGYGYNEYKEWFGNRPQERAEVLMPLTRTGHMLVTGITVLDKLNGSCRQLAKKAGLVKRIKKFLRGGK